jgi:acyl carrier protein
MNNNPTQSNNYPKLTSQVIDIIFSALNLRHIDRTTVVSETSITKDGLNLDSIDILELVVQLENNFKFKFKENESYNEHFKNIGSLVQFINTNKTTS